MLTLMDINRALDRLGTAAFVSAQRRRQTVQVALTPPIRQPRWQRALTLIPRGDS